MLVLRCFTGFSLVAQSWGYPAFVVCGLLTAVAFLVLGHELQAMRASAVLARGLRSVGVGLVGMWNVLGVEIEPVSPALSSGFLASGPSGKSGSSYF